MWRDLLQMTVGMNGFSISLPAAMDYLLHVIFSSSSRSEVLENFVIVHPWTLHEW